MAKLIPFVKRKWLHLTALLLIVWLLVVAYTVVAFRQQPYLVKTVQEDCIEQQQKWSYSAEVFPCTLYPKGGLIENSPIFSKVTRNLRIKLNYRITAQNSLTARGSTRISYRLLAEDLWQREYPVRAAAGFELSGTAINVLSEEIAIPLAPLQAFIDSVEKETLARPRDYYLEIVPQISGAIEYQGRQVALEPVQPLRFRWSNVITLAEDCQTQFDSEYAITSTQRVEQPFVLLGRQVDLAAARRVLAALAVCFTIALVLVPVKLCPRRRRLSEVQRIDRKYKSRVVRARAALALINKSEIELHSLKDLLRMSDEVEQPVMRIQCDTRLVKYCVMAGDTVYVYSALDIVPAAPDVKGDEGADWHV